MRDSLAAYERALAALRRPIMSDTRADTLFALTALSPLDGR
jgi:hypothetical protein